ncbi:hypothetical protein N7522_009460 [Penicillium canescens]|nr:hypothetical protein N7522_009460 [Penicillium canescens]
MFLGNNNRGGLIIDMGYIRNTGRNRNGASKILDDRGRTAYRRCRRKWRDCENNAHVEDLQGLQYTGCQEPVM